jgi:hypothetical protein
MGWEGMKLIRNKELRMRKIQYLHIRFENRLSIEELAVLVDLIAHKMQKKSIFFIPDVDRYPLIQYKLNRNRLSMVCLDEGSNDVNYLLQSDDLQFCIADKKITLSIEDFKINYFTLQSWNTQFDYRIHNWIPLGDMDAYISFTQMDKHEKRIGLLQEILSKDLSSIYQELGCEIDNSLEIDLTSPIKISFSENMSPAGFSFNFTSNLSIPQYAGLGINAMLGYGTISRINKIRIN